MAKTVMTELGFTDIEAGPPKLKGRADPIPTSRDLAPSTTSTAHDISELSKSPRKSPSPRIAPAAPVTEVGKQLNRRDSTAIDALSRPESPEDEDEEEADDHKAEDAELESLAGKKFNVSPADAERIHTTMSREYALVWRTLRRFGVEHGEVDDATQLSFLAFSWRIGDVKVGRERSFLIGVCSRTAANFRRKAARRREVCTESLDREPDERSSPEALFHLKEQRRALELLLGHLSPNQREVFVLYEYEGWTLPEIAESLSLRLGTCTSRLRRARERAAQLYGDDK